MDQQTLLKNCFNTIKERGFYYQSTGEKEVEQLLTSKPTTIYFGIDPTADSLHIGHCFPLFMIKRLQQAGHKIIVLVGGATAMVGDPTGRTDMRKMIEQDFINSNLEKIKGIINKFLKPDGDNPYILVNNADWYKGYEYIAFMRDIGVHFNVNKMLATDAYSKRMEEGGLTFFEMGYMLMQAYDFVYLNKHYGCTLQVGGQDQWANMLAGAELGRKLNFLQGKPTQNEFHALTVPLLTNSEGKKMGKTEKGALWVSEEKTSVFDFYQYFYNVDDADTEKLLKTMTDLSLKEIDQLLKGDIRQAKRAMAFEITKALHGQEKALAAQNLALELFSSGMAVDAPEVEISSAELPLDMATVCVMANIASSKGEARKLIAQGGLTLNGEKVQTHEQTLTKQHFEKDGFAMIKKGKKTFVKVVLK
jgi:tyrosyl-tRNA synthetase